MPTATAKQTALVSKDELLELADWEKKYADAKKKVSAAETELKFRRQALAEKVLGLKSADELKALSPKQVQTLYAKRLSAGDWQLQRGAPTFVFLKTSEGRYPAWKQLFTDIQGETAAAEISANTSPIYSYAIQVAAQ